MSKLPNPRNSIDKVLRSTSKNPEPQTFLKAKKYQKVYWSGKVPMKQAKGQFGAAG